MKWTVQFSGKAHKQVKKLSTSIIAVLRLLIEDLSHNGPYPGEGWLNYSKLNGEKNIDKRHCHLKKGKPTYVCCWQVIDKKIRIIEVYYVGTHENAPY
jgi:mRNA-degrading endonuclease RelE of RelBE toxin-antitoxin system